MSDYYKHISLSERRQIYRLQDQGHSPRRIAEILGRHTSTIYREVRRNTYKHEERDCSGYFPVTAQDLALRRRERMRKLERNPNLMEFITIRLRQHWSPEQIAGYLKRVDGVNGLRICHETIYRYVYSTKGREMGLYRHLFRARKNRRRRFSRIPRSRMIPYERTIHARSTAIASRQEFGHWEGDLMIFERALGNTNVTTLIERKSRYTVVLKNKGRRPAEVLTRIGENLGELPGGARKTITFDRGFEFLQYPLLQKQCGVASYFCDPRSPWQKGAVENANARLRRWLPRNRDLSILTEADMKRISAAANDTPRKCLGYKTPKEVFEAHLHEDGDPFIVAA